MQTKSGCLDILPQETVKLTTNVVREELQVVPQFVSALKRCSKARDLKCGKTIYREAVARGYHTNNYVAANLITMFSKCRSMRLAQEVFDQMKQRDVVTWNSLILGYADNGQSLVALDLFNSIDCEPTSVTYIAVLKACGRLANETSSGGKCSSLETGVAVHDQVERQGLVSDIVVATSLIDMYSKCGSVQRARQVFDRMTTLNAVSWNALILGYLNNGDLAISLQLFISMDCEPNVVTFVAALKIYGCLAAENVSKKQVYLEKAIDIRKQVKVRGLDSDLSVSTALMNAFWKCGCLELAKEVFEKMVHRDVVAWNSFIIGYVEHGQYLIAMDLVIGMDCKRNAVTYATQLKAYANMASDNLLHKCFCLKKGVEFHKSLEKSDTDIVVTNALIDMYSKCGNMKLAKATFDSLNDVNIITWTSLLLGYVDSGDYLVAMDLLTVLQCEPNSVTYVAALKACGGMCKQLQKKFCLEKGVHTHKQAKDRGFHSDVVMATTLVDMYSKCGNMQMAQEVFDGMTSRNTVAWNSLIVGYANNGLNWLALRLLDVMDCEQDHVTYVAALKACGNLVAEDESSKDFFLEYGTGIHKLARDCGYDSLRVVATALVDTYRKCGSLERAKEVFDGMNDRDVIAWNSLMLGYVNEGEFTQALELYDSMDCEQDCFTFVAALKACGGLASGSESKKKVSLVKGSSIHRVLKDRGCDVDVVLANALVDMYCKCGGMAAAREVFNSLSHRDTITWNCLISGCVSNGEYMEALRLLDQMDCVPDSFTYVAVLKACGGLSGESEANNQVSLQHGINVHGKAVHHGFEKLSNMNNSLIDMYAKCRSMLRARTLFDSLASRESATWNTLMLGYVDNGMYTEALELLTAMDGKPNSSTYAHALKACGGLGAFLFGQHIYAQVCRLGFEEDHVLMTSSMSFYGRCGLLSRAEEVFNMLHSPDKVAWGTLIAVYCTLGDTSQVFSMAKRMQEAGYEMDGITFTVILTACSHAGLVEKAELYFKSKLGFNVSVSREHYNCMVDMLSRANRLEDALELINKMPFEANSVTWMSLLGGCRTWRNSTVEKIATSALLSFQVQHSEP